MHRIAFGGRAPPGPAGGALAAIWGPTSKGRGGRKDKGKGREEGGGEGKGREG